MDVKCCSGVDLVDIQAFEEQLKDPGSRFLSAVFTAGERAECRHRSSPEARHLAARYAAKEAFVKAWSAFSFGRPPALPHVDLCEIEVINDRWGRPALRFHGEVAQALGRDTSASLSLSHDGGYAIALVTLMRVEAKSWDP